MEAELHTRILAVFPTKSVPDRSQILYNEAPEYKGSFPVDEELEEIRAFFSGRDWLSLEPKDVFRFRHALSFFSSRALAYYTPAWLRCGLADENEVDTAVEDMISVFVRSPRDLWTENQRSVICDWVKHIMNRWRKEGVLSEALKERCEHAVANICPAAVNTE